MATKDYVTRSQTIKKKGKNKNHQAKVNWFRISLAILLLSAFIWGLYFLASIDNSQEVSPSSNADASAPEQVEEPSLNKDESLEQLSLPPLPKLQEEQWEYIDSLPDFQVEVDTKGPLESDRQYIMQCGSFRTFERADELKAKLAFQGLESRILKSDGSNGIWHRVVLGPYERKRNAERDRHTLRDANIRGCKIW